MKVWLSIENFCSQDTLRLGHTNLLSASRYRNSRFLIRIDTLPQEAVLLPSPPVV